MKNRTLYLLLYVLLCVVFRQNTASAQTPATQTSSVETASETARTDAHLVHFGDLIDVDVIGSVEYDWRGTLNPEGFLDGVERAENPIYALCRSEAAIAEEISRAYSKDLREPKVVVRILDRSNRPLSFLYGAIKTPQRFQIKRPVYLNELLVVAGGLTEKASGEIQIFRPQNLSCQAMATKENESGISGGAGGVRERFVAASRKNTANYINIKITDLLGGKKEANPRILNGDVVTVLEAESIYVIGGVANPKQISSRAQELTLSRAVAAAGGATKNADLKKVTVYRREAGATKIIEADLEKIKSGAAEDLVLRAFDIVEVPQTGSRPAKFPPVLKIAEIDEKQTANLPLRIID